MVIFSTGEGNSDNVKLISGIVTGGIILIVIIVALTACVISKSKYRGVTPLNAPHMNHKRVPQTKGMTSVPPKFPDPPARVGTDLFEQLELPGLLIQPNETALYVKRVHFSDGDF